MKDGHDEQQRGGQQPEGEKLGFWRRVFGSPEEEEAAAASPDARPRPAERRNAPAPRPQERTIFDRAEQEQRKRYARAALLRRERLAHAITDRVEQVIQERMDTGEEKLARAAGAMGEMNSLLGSIGRNLDQQSARSERAAQAMELLPGYAEEERDVLRTIASQLEGQATSVEAMPEMLAVVRQGAQTAHERLHALQTLHDELRVQRDQRALVLDTLRSSASQFQEHMTRLEESLTAGAVQARKDAQSLRESLQHTTERLLEQGREDARREEARQAAATRDLHEVTLRMSESNTLAVLGAKRQEASAKAFHGAHEELIDLLQRSHSQTITEMHRIQDDVREQEEAIARRNRMALVGSAGFLAVLGVGLFFSRPEPTARPLAPRVAPRAATAPAQPSAPAAPPAPEGARTLPASMPRATAPADEVAPDESVADEVAGADDH